MRAQLPTGQLPPAAQPTAMPLRWNPNYPYRPAAVSPAALQVRKARLPAHSVTNAHN